MKKIIILLGICVFSLGFISNVLAQEDDLEQHVIADVNFVDQKILSQQDHSLRISVTLKNMIGTQSGILYGLKAYREVDGKQFIVDQFVPFDPILLSQNETVTKEFEYTLPRVLGGDISLFVFAETERGVPLALATLGSVSLTGIKPSVDLKECAFSIDNKTIDCVVENISDTLAQAIINTKVIKGNSLLGPTLFTIPGKIIELNPGEKKTDSSELNLEVPPEGLFIETTLYGVDDAFPNEKFNFIIPAWESVSKISNLLIEQKNAAEYLIKVVTLDQQTNMSARVGFVGESGECAVQTVPLTGSVTEVLFTFNSSCQTVAIKADLVNQSGEVIDSLSVSHQVAISGVGSKAKTDIYIYYVVTALALLILILIILRRVKSVNVINIVVIGLFVLSANGADAATILGTRTYTNSTMNPAGTVTVHFALTYPSQLQVNTTGFFSINDLSTSPGNIAQAGLAKNSTPPPTGVPLNIGSNNWTQTGQTPFSHINTGTFTLSFSPYLINPNPSSGWSANSSNPFTGSIEITEQTGGGSTGSGGPLYSISAGPIVCENGKAKTNISWIVPSIMPGEVTMNGAPFADSYVGGGSKWTTTNGDVNGEGLLTPGATYTFRLYSATVYTGHSVTVTANCGSGGYVPPNNTYQYRCDAANSGNSCSFQVNQPCAVGEAGCFSGSSGNNQCANYCGAQRYTCGGGCVACGQLGQPECINGSYTSINACQTVCEQSGNISCGYVAEPAFETVGNTVDLELTTQYPFGGTPGSVGGSGAYYNPNIVQCIYNTIPNEDGGNSTFGTANPGFWSGLSSPLILGENAFNATCYFSYTDNTGVPVDGLLPVACLSNGATGGAPGYRCSSSCAAGPACTSSDSDCYASAASCTTNCVVSTTPTATINATNCDIPVGRNYCQSTVSWNTQNITMPSIRENGAQFTVVASNILGTSRTIYHGDTTYSVFDIASNTQRASASANAKCESGSTWNSSSNTCVANDAPKLIICPTTVPPIQINGQTQLQAWYWTSYNGTPNCSNTGGATNVTNNGGTNWTSNTLALVNNGLVTGVAEGTAVIEAEYSGLTATKNVQVIDGVVYPEPTIAIKSNPSIVRSGQIASVTVNITGAEYQLDCEFSGAVPSSENFTHNGGPGNGNLEITVDSVPLTSARVAKVTCTDPNGTPPYSDETTISVIPTFQEI